MMENRKTLVLTMYGHEGQVDEVLVNLFEIDGSGTYRDRIESNSASRYCDFINSLNLKDGKWVYAAIINEGERVILKAAAPQSFDYLILALEDRGLQKLAREVDKRDLAVAITGAGEEAREKVFRNVSKNHAAMIKEEIKASAASPSQIDAAQKKVLDMVHELSRRAEIVFD